MLDDGQGSYSYFGRLRDPNAADIAAAEHALARLGRAGWLAILTHPPDATTPPEIIQVRPLLRPTIPFAQARDALLRRLRQG